MKSILLSIAFLLSSVATAAPLSQADLDKINNYIEKYVAENVPFEGFEAKVLEANKNEESGLLDSTKALINWDSLIEAQFDLALQNDVELTLGGNIKVRELMKAFGNDSTDQEYQQDVLDYKVDMIESVAAISKIAENDEKLDVFVEYQDDSGSFNVIFMANPKEGVELDALKSLVLTVTYIDATETLLFGFAFSGKSDSQELSQAKVYLSAILGNLLAEVEPKDEDLQGLVDSVFSTYDKVSEELDKYLYEIF